MAQLGQLLAVLTALAILPGVSAAQIHPAGSQSVDGRVYVKVYVTLPNASIRYNPMEGVPVVIYRARGDSLAIRTDGAGETTFLLEPGSYRVVTGRPVISDGVQYEWDTPIDVYAGMAAVDLNQRNATVAGGDRPQLAERSLRGPMQQSVSPVQAAQPVLVYSEKSGTTAFLLSFLITGAGQIYAGETGKGVSLLLLDIGGTALLINGAASCAGYGSHCEDGQIAAGAALALGTWIYSMADAPGAAGRYNQKHARALPVVGVGPRGDAKVGVRLALGR
jgi:TM2 domain-containing membrane protein YozV